MGGSYHKPRGRVSFPTLRVTLEQHREQYRRATLVMSEYRRLLLLYGLSVTDDELVCNDDAEVALAKRAWHEASEKFKLEGTEYGKA